ncbi:hypothetical protein [Lambdina fiscellaria nucleopolyhedrovirus]|uniref:Uncharacterized protein n=1 Tax=Lambdina fiscellaria nucleopolyhedrovirus TaxID=1642929 RepID=A0A0E3Z8C6_9ABAC|nr:hypothetical protein [Lambdina fiscellaria nucleopolyhedrovirus]AKC91758.1 hypothetical protein [Lambdina fiscellaria nucleopolyhedrovirus]
MLKKKDIANAAAATTIDLLKIYSKPPLLPPATLNNNCSGNDSTFVSESVIEAPHTPPVLYTVHSMSPANIAQNAVSPPKINSTTLSTPATVDCDADFSMKADVFPKSVKVNVENKKNPK